jgi:hypothetical protein
MNGILSASFDQTRSLLIALGWLAALGAAAALLYRRTTRTAGQPVHTGTGSPPSRLSADPAEAMQPARADAVKELPHPPVATAPAR